jgi:hypothetical protein
MVCSANRLLHSWLGICVNFIPNSEGSLALFLLVACPHIFLQSIVCRSAVDCLKSQRVVLLLQDMRQEGAFAYFSNSFAVLAGHLCEFHTKK